MSKVTSPSLGARQMRPQCVCSVVTLERPRFQLHWSPTCCQCKAQQCHFSLQPPTNRLINQARLQNIGSVACGVCCIAGTQSCTDVSGIPKAGRGLFLAAGDVSSYTFAFVVGLAGRRGASSLLQHLVHAQMSRARITTTMRQAPPKKQYATHAL